MLGAIASNLTDKDGDTSSPAKNYRDVASGSKCEAISDSEMEYIIDTLSGVEIDSSVADVVTNDPKVSSKEIPYYRNNNHRIYSVFETPIPEDLEIIQNINLYLIAQIPLASLVRIPYPKPGLKTDLKFSKLGKSTKLKKFCSELIFLLEISKSIDYSETKFKGFSKLGSWLFKTVLRNRRDATEKVVHVNLTKEDHNFLRQELDTEGETLVYRAFQQTIVLLAMIASLPEELSEITKRVSSLIGNKITGLVLKKNLSDSSNIEPYYIWSSVTTPEERGYLTKKVGENFFNRQNGLLRKFRSKNPENSEKELKSLKQLVDTKLNNGIKSTIYGRLKFYMSLKKRDDIKNTLSKRTGTKQLSVIEVHREAAIKGVLSIFATENIIATASDLIKKPIEIMDLTRLVLYHNSTDTTYYLTGDLESSTTYTSLRDTPPANLSKSEELLLNSIMSRSFKGSSFGSKS
jgi:hypothetical protein